MSGKCVRGVSNSKYIPQIMGSMVATTFVISFGKRRNKEAQDDQTLPKSIVSESNINAKVRMLQVVCNVKLTQLSGQSDGLVRGPEPHRERLCQTMFSMAVFVCVCVCSSCLQHAQCWLLSSAKIKTAK